MTHLEILEAFELEINALDDGLNKPKTDDSLYFLNNSLYKFNKTRILPHNPVMTGFEGNTKRIEDFRRLIERVAYEDSKDAPDGLKIHSNGSNEYSVKLPLDNLFVLSDLCGILPIGDAQCSPGVKCWQKECDGSNKLVITTPQQVTQDSVNRQMESSLSEHNLHHGSARPLRLIEGDTVILYTDGQYKVSNYSLTYLRKPSKIQLDEPFKEYTDLPEHAILEIVKIAAQAYIENQMNPRYESIVNEVNNME